MADLFTDYTNLGIKIGASEVTANLSGNLGIQPASIGALSTIPNVVTNSVSPGALSAGQLVAQLSSSNFVTGSAGWAIFPDGSVEFNSGVFRATISGATIIGGTIETASGTGQRIVLSGSDNTLRIYDSSNVQILGLGTSNSPAGVIVINPDSGTNNGIYIGSSQNGVGFYYSNTTNVANKGIYLESTSTGASNINPVLEIQTKGNYYGQFINATDAAKGLLIQKAGTGNVFDIINSGSGSSITINDSGTTGTSPCIDLSYARSGAAINIAVSHSGGNPTALNISSINSGGNSYAFNFVGGANSETVSAAVTGTQNKKIRVLVAGAVYYIPLYDA